MKFHSRLHCSSATAALLAAALLAGCAETSTRVDDAAHASATDTLAGADLYTRGADAYRTGDKAAAKTLLEHAVAVNPNLRMAQAMLGDLYRVSGDYKNAAAHFDVAARLDPYSLPVAYNKGLMHQYITEFQTAAAAYLHALELSPSDLKSTMNLGTVYLALGETSGAVDNLTKATTLDPKSAEAWSNLGVALDTAGKAADAEKAYRKSIELKPMQSTLQNLAANLISQRRAPEAVQILKSFTQNASKNNLPSDAPTPALLKTFADALTAAKQYDQAFAQYNMLLTTNPRYVSALNGKANALYEQYKDGFELDDAKLEAAVVAWKQSLAINSNQPAIASIMARASHTGIGPASK